MNDHLSNRQVLYGPSVPLFNYNPNHDPQNGQFTFGDGGGGDNGRFTRTSGNSSPIAGSNSPLPTHSRHPSDLHPRTSLKQLATATGAGGTIAGADVPPQTTLPTSTSPHNPRQQAAIHRALNLSLNPNTDRKDGSSRNPYISHYGGDWDPNKDSNTNPPPGSGRKPTGNHDNDLNANSLAISSDVAKANHLVVGKGVYINGQYLGNYDDTTDEKQSRNSIDVYDPKNVPNNKYWGGTVKGGARVTSGPPH